MADTHKIKIKLTKDEYDYIILVIRRKAINLKDYLFDNFEWDGDPECFEGNNLPSYSVCDGCEHFEVCPDAFGRQV